MLLENQLHFYSYNPKTCLNVNFKYPYVFHSLPLLGDPARVLRHFSTLAKATTCRKLTIYNKKKAKTKRIQKILRPCLTLPKPSRRICCCQMKPNQKFRAQFQNTSLYHQKKGKKHHTKVMDTDGGGSIMIWAYFSPD